MTVFTTISTRILLKGEGCIVGDLDLRDKPYPAFPEKMVVQGNLTLHPDSVGRLPRRLVVQGNMTAHHVRIQHFPEELRVSGGLYMHHSQVRALSRDLVLMGDLDLRHSSISTLPENMHIRRNLSLQGTNLVLPRALTVDGTLDLADSQIPLLPEGLRVGGRLNMHNTRIRSLPPDMLVGGMITPGQYLHDVEAFRQTLRPGSSTTLSMCGSFHDRMRTRHDLALYPDLARILESNPGGRLFILRRDQGPGSISWLH